MDKHEHYPLQPLSFDLHWDGFNVKYLHSQVVHLQNISLVESVFRMNTVYMIWSLCSHKTIYKRPKHKTRSESRDIDEKDIVQ